MSEHDADVDRDIPLARAGSVEALGRALERFRAYLLTVANRQLDPALNAKGGASDIVQETFLEAQRDFSQFEGTNGTELRAWLLRMMENNLANFARAYKGTEKRQIAREVGLASDRPSGWSGGIAGDTPTPSMEAMADERAAALARAIERLPADYRQVIMLRNHDDQSFSEIAATMQRSENAVRKLWFRAVEALQKELDTVP
jgi:RNA polymerase sigma-70 factor (ECF subfamily)